MAQHRKLSQESRVDVAQNANNEQLILNKDSHSAAPLAEMSPDDLPSHTSPTFVQTPALDDIRSWMAEELNYMDPEFDSINYCSFPPLSMAQHQESAGVYVDYNANDEQPPIQTQGSQPTAPPAEVQGQLASHLNDSRLFLTGPGDLPYMPHTSLQTPSMDATRSWAEGQNDVTLRHDNFSSVDRTRFDFQDLLSYLLGGNGSPQFSWSQSILPHGAVDLPMLTDFSPPSPAGPFAAGSLSGQDDQSQFGGNEQEQPDQVPLSWFISPDGAVDLSTLTGSSPPLPVGPLAAGHLSGQDDQGGNEHSQPGRVPLSLLIPNPPSTVAGPPTGTSLTTTTTMEPSAAETHAAAEDNIRTVGSPGTRQASAMRRKKDAIHQCPFDSCDSTFTEPHNLQYHIYSHLDINPYECTECPYATNSPATLTKHMKSLHR